VSIIRKRNLKPRHAPPRTVLPAPNIRVPTDHTNAKEVRKLPPINIPKMDKEEGVTVHTTAIAKIKTKMKSKFLR
jgi:hypothetical protein